MLVKGDHENDGRSQMEVRWEAYEGVQQTNMKE